MKTFDSAPGLDLVEQIDSIKLPEFYNPSAWVLEECYKMLV